MSSTIFTRRPVANEVFGALIALTASNEIGATIEAVHFSAESSRVCAIDPVALEESRAFSAARTARGIATDDRVETGGISAFYRCAVESIALHNF